MTFLIALFARWGLSKRVASVLGHLVPLALVAAVIGFLWLRGDHYREQRDTARAQVETVNTKLAVSNASIDALEKTLVAYVSAGKASQVAQTAALAAQEPHNAELQRQAAAIRAEVAKGAAGCETPESVRGARGL